MVQVSQLSQGGKVMEEGIVVYLNNAYGFVAPLSGGADVYLRLGKRTLGIGQQVFFVRGKDTERGPRAKRWRLPKQVRASQHECRGLMMPTHMQRHGYRVMAP